MTVRSMTAELEDELSDPDPSLEGAGERLPETQRVLDRLRAVPQEYQDAHITAWSVRDDGEYHFRFKGDFNLSSHDGDGDL